MTADELEASRREIPRTKIATDGEGRLVVAWETHGGRLARARFYHHDTTAGKRRYCLVALNEPVEGRDMIVREPTLGSIPRGVRRAVSTPSIALRGPCDDDHGEIDEEGDEPVENMEGFA